MSLRGFLVTIFVVVACWVISAPATSRYMPIDEVRPGMVGIERTVFEGTRVEEFKAHILGVLRTALPPRPSSSTSSRSMARPRQRTW